MKVLVTGSRGFVGGAFGRFAAQQGHEVLGIGRSSQPDAGWAGAHIQADVAQADLSGTIRAFSPDVILHAAGAASVSDSITQPLDDLKASLVTWANALEGVRRSGIRPVVIFPSSAAVYGNPELLPVREDSPCAPISPYGFHKAACELIAREYAECFGLRIVICRLFSVFGPTQRRLLVWEIYKQLAGSDAIVSLSGTGAEARDYLHIDDVASAMLQLAGTPSVDGCVTVNTAGGVETNVLQLAEKMRAIVAPQKQIVCRGQSRAGDPARWRADIGSLRSLLPGWEPKSLDDGLASCIEAWQRGTLKSA